MAKKIKQFRYYNDNATNNYPSGLSWIQLVSGSAFGTSMPIVQLGIQSMPGTKFYLNGAVNPIILGSTGIYELDLQGMTQINALSFDANSINFIKSNNNAYLIVDIVYEEVGA